MPERTTVPGRSPTRVGVGGWLWNLRVELVVAAVSAGVYDMLAARVGSPAACVATVAGWAALLSVRGSRTWLGGVWGRARARRRFVTAARRVGLLPGPPRVVAVASVPAGEALTVAVPVGGTVAGLEAAAEAVAAALQVRELRVTRDPANARRARVVVVRRDPLADPAPWGWPNAEAERLSLWEPVRVGVSEDGEQVAIALAERNLLIGGEPGAGKSAALSLVVATAALDPSVRLWLLDGKLVELAGWAGCAEHSVGVSVAEAIDVLRSLQADMELRYARLLSERRRKVTAGDGLGLDVVVVDELAHYLTAGDRKERAEFAELSRDLVARGRAAGVIFVGATQKPSADVIPTFLRDLFGFRWAMRCATPQASDTILGAGWASAGFSAAAIDAACRGVGWLLHEGGRPVRVRSFWLDDDTLAAIALRAELARGNTR